jgi:hypothetical protein
VSNEVLWTAVKTKAEAYYGPIKRILERSSAGASLHQSSELWVHSKGVRAKQEYLIGKRDHFFSIPNQSSPRGEVSAAGDA